MLGLWNTNFALQEERRAEGGEEPCHWTSAMGLPSNPSLREEGGWERTSVGPPSSPSRSRARPSVRASQ